MRFFSSERSSENPQNEYKTLQQLVTLHDADNGKNSKHESNTLDHENEQNSKLLGSNA